MEHSKQNYVQALQTAHDMVTPVPDEFDEKDILTILFHIILAI